MTIDGLGSFIRESEEDDARLIEDTKGEDLAEVEVEGENDTGVRSGAANDFVICGAL